jgi:aquaporin related protein
MIGVFFTGGSLNPARSFGPDVVLGRFDGYHWIYWLGPLLGAILAVIFYRLIKTLEYETANPGADGDGHELHDYHGSRGRTSYDDTRATSKLCPPLPSPYPGQHLNGTNANASAAHRTTDGTDETDFGTRVQTAKSGPVTPSRQVGSSSQYDTTFTGSTMNGEVSQPMPAFTHGGDGHHRSHTGSESLDHPNERPRAKHTRSSRRSSQSHYEMASNNSYRHGPSAESGRSSS